MLYIAINEVPMIVVDSSFLDELEQAGSSETLYGR